MYTIGHLEGQPAIQWMAEPTWREPRHPEGQVGRGKADGEDAAELDRAQKEKEKRQKEAAAEGLDMQGDGRDRKDMLQEWAQRLRGKARACQNVLIDNGEAQPGLEARIKGCRGEEVRQAVSKASYHLKARADAMEDKCRPECTLARCLRRLDGPQEPKGGYHGIGVWQPRRQGPMWLQMGEEEGAPLVYFHQVKHMWVGYADGRSGTVGEEEEAGERQAEAQILTARMVEPKRAVLWMQMQRDAQVAVYVDSTSRTVEVWGPGRQVLAMALYVGETVRRSRGMAGEADPDTEMHRLRKVMTMADYDQAAGRWAKGHTIQVVFPQASATGAADQGVTDLVQDGHTWLVVELRVDRRQAVVYTAAPLRRVVHPLMRGVGEVEEVRVERTDVVRKMAVLRALESQMDSCAEAEEAEDIREQIRLASEWVASSRGGEQPRWLVAPGTEDGHRKEALKRAGRLREGARKQGLEVEDDQGGGRPSRWRGMRRGRGGQMRFIVGDGNGEEERDEREQDQAWGVEGRELGLAAGGREEREEGEEGVEEGEAEGGGQQSAAGDRVHMGAVERGQERVVRGKAASGGERRTRRICKQSGSRRRKGNGGQE